MMRMALLAVLFVFCAYAQLPKPGGSGGGGGGGGGGGFTDAPSGGIANVAGGGSGVWSDLYPIVNSSGWTPSSCTMSLAIAPTGSSLIVDMQYFNGTIWVSIFGSTKLVFTTSFTAPGVVTQSTFSGTFPLAAGTLIRAQVTQNDSGNTAQFGYVRCH